MSELSDRAFMSVVKILPRRWLTRRAAALSSLELPRAVRAPIYHGYAKLTGANVEEAGRPADAYPSLGEFFARDLKPGLREWPGPGVWGSPADGRLSARGRIRSGSLIQAKGIRYSLRDFVDSDELADACEGGHYATVYLSPADYHRVHAPAALDVCAVRSAGGELWPVNGPSTRRVDGLFVRNERVIFEFESRGMRGALVMVGATVVGSVRTARRSPVGHYRQGDELGAFLLGSTVVLITAAGTHSLCDVARADGERVVCGDAIWCFDDAGTSP